MTKNKDIYPYEFDSCDGVVYNEEECLPKEDIVDIDIPDYYIGKKYIANQTQLQELVFKFGIGSNLMSIRCEYLTSYEFNDRFDLTFSLSLAK